MKDEDKIFSERDILVYVVISTFYKDISEKQLKNATNVLTKELNLREDQIKVISV